MPARHTLVSQGSRATGPCTRNCRPPTTTPPTYSFTPLHPHTSHTNIYTLSLALSLSLSPIFLSLSLKYPPPSSPPVPLMSPPTLTAPCRALPTICLATQWLAHSHDATHHCHALRHLNLHICCTCILSMLPEIRNLLKTALLLFVQSLCSIGGKRRARCATRRPSTAPWHSNCPLNAT
jgi:hypothetical protein